MRTLVALLAVLLAACQPVDDIPRQPVQPPTAGQSPSERLGAPGTGMPRDLAALRSDTDEAARQWQDAPRAAEIRVDLDGSGRWSAASVMYVAADADRLLSVSTEGSGYSVQRTTLATLDLQPVPEAALAVVPPLEAPLEPAELVERGGPVLERCDIAGQPTTILYRSGAPFTWDGRQWTEPPQWVALVLVREGVGVVLDPVTGDARDDACVTA